MLRSRTILTAALLLAPLAGALAEDSAEAQAPEPGQSEWAQALDALDQGETLMVQARQVGPREPDLKRQAYTQAETCLKTSLGWIDAYLVVRPEPQTTVEETMARIHRDLYECHKSKPLQIS